METGTASGAAEIVGISQPADSQLIDALEASLALTLFGRRSGHMEIRQRDVCSTPISCAHLPIATVRPRLPRVLSSRGAAVFTSHQCQS